MQYQQSVKLVREKNVLNSASKDLNDNWVQILMPIEVDGEMCEADKGSQWVGGVDPECYLLCSDDD